MTWADRRKHLIEAILIVCALALIAVVAIATFYKAPSCMDGQQNDGEQGVDCGGPCPFACSFPESAPLVRFVRAVYPQPGRTDVIAYIDNSNSNAQLVNAPYAITLYNAHDVVLAHMNGRITIPPSTTYPLYIPGLYNGNQQVTQAFVTFTTSSYIWLRTTQKPLVPHLATIQTQNSAAPKISATLTNATAQTLHNLTVVATVFNSSNNAIAASQTLVPQLPPQGSAPIIFTWNQAFVDTPARVEILPVPLAASS